MACCPNPDNAPAYAHMVLAGSIHRTIVRHAHRLSQAARIDTAGNLQPGNTLTAAKKLADTVRKAASRWGATAPRPGSLPAPDRPAPSPSSQTRDEEALLAALAASPDTIPHTARWLSPHGIFCHDRHKIIYECMTALHHRGDPIDPVTLTWEAQQRGALVHNRLTPRDIRHLITPRTGESAYWADRLLKTALVRTAATAAAGIRSAAEEPVTEPGDLISAAQTAVVQITEAHQRWQGHLRGVPDVRAGPGRPVVHYGRTVTPPGNCVPAAAAPAPDRRPR
ncbi:DnaB-like helicase N-terminal domain-containing protein [Streptomyces sp. G-5]|uniref:DnaB-like helicase N-terminal domain-containing protein n=1 Tax=Streptomyces sp. G-5 TaxID=2977231 RepID=UPI00397737AD